MNIVMSWPENVLYGSFFVVPENITSSLKTNMA